MGTGIAPAVAKRAAAAGLDLVQMTDRVEVRQGKKVLSFNIDPKTALDRALELLEEKRIQKILKDGNNEPILHIPEKKNGATVRLGVPGVPPLPPAAPVPALGVPDLPAAAPITIQDEARMGAAIANSIIKTKYKDRYKTKGGSCGDDIAEELSEYLRVIIKGKLQIDLKKLEEVAKKNEVWKESYRGLNAGQQRMTIGNRLRARYAEGLEVDIGGVVLIDPECLK